MADRIVKRDDEAQSGGTTAGCTTKADNDFALGFAAGQSAERARQQGLIAKWREYVDRKRLKANLVVGAMYESGQADTLFACADELESAP